MDKLISRALVALFLLASASLPVRAAENLSPIGKWLIERGDGVIEVYHCGDNGLCGRIVGMTEPFDGDHPRTDNNGQPQCGLTIMDDFTANPDGTWTQGTIRNPETGHAYGAEISMTPTLMHLRGYFLIPLLGSTQDWTPYTKPLGPHCAMS